MPIYRKGDEQFGLELRASFQPNQWQHPETVKSLLDNPGARVESDRSGVARAYEFWHPPVETVTKVVDEDGEGEDTETHYPSYYLHREYPVSGDDLAKLKRGR